MTPNHNGPTWTLKGVTVMECEPCGYVHLWPLPTYEELGQLYVEEYYQTYNAGWFKKERREQWYWHRVYQQRTRYAMQVSKYQEYRKWMLSSFKVLDYGAGCGWFVKAAQDYSPFCDVIGCELSKEAIEWAKKNGVASSLLPPAMLNRTQEESFVHLSFVLEHFRCPVGLLKSLRHKLITGGLLCIIVPNEFNPLQRRLARWGYSPLHPHHVNYFTPDSLTQLVERAGFDVIRRSATFPMEWFALHGLNYVKHPKLGRVAHWIRMAVEAAALSTDPDAWERRRDAWAERGIGREIELWARKRSPAS